MSRATNRFQSVFSGPYTSDVFAGLSAQGEGGVADCHKALESLYSVLFSMTRVMVKSALLLSCSGIAPDFELHSLKCTSGGLYVPCIYMHAG